MLAHHRRCLGSIALKSTALVDPNVFDKLSSELKFIAKGTGDQLPFLSVLAKEKMILFVD
jgi:hypothetical protein